MSASIEPIQVADSEDLLRALRQQEAQVQALRLAYSAAMARNAMTYWLAIAARELRRARGRKVVHVAAEADRAESTLSRFERHLNVPEDIDATVAAYARDLEIEPIELWARALELWREAEVTSPRPGGDDEAGGLGGAADRLLP